MTSFSMLGAFYEGMISSTDYFGRMVTDLESNKNPDFSSLVPQLECKKITIKK